MVLDPNPDLLWFVAGYGLVMILLGIWFSRRITSSDDFILAGKALGPIVLAGTMLATFTGSGTVTGGVNSIGYSYGFWPANLLAPGVFVAFAVLYLIAPKIRNYGKYTVAQILESKYGQGARIASTLIIILAYTGIVSYQFKGLAFVLNISTGIPVETGTIISALLIIFLAVIGGLMAVAPTDALSAFLMIIGLVVAVPFALNAGGGWAQVISSLPPENLTITGSMTPLQLAGFMVPFMFLLLGDQNIYQRLASSNGEKSARSGLLLMAVGLFFITPVVPFLAMIARSIFPDISPGMALISMTTVMPTLFGGILLAAVAAFIVTTGNSYLLSAATSLTYDIYVRHFRPEAGSKEILFFTKTCIPAIGLVAYVLLAFFPTILKIQMTSYMVYGAGITPAVLAVFLWPQVNKWGGISSMVAGAGSTLVFQKSFGMAAAALAVPVAVGVLVAVTLATCRGHKEIRSDLPSDSIS